MKQKKNKHTAGTIVGIILLVFAVLLCSFAIWGFSTWKGLTLDEIIYHLNAPLEGTGNGMIQSGLLHTLIPAAIALVIAIIFGKKLSSRQDAYRRLLHLERIGACVVIVVVLVFSWNRLALGDYLKNEFDSSTFIEDNYRDPAQASITFPAKKRNLIYIYMESMEMTYSDKADGGAFDQDVIPELTKISEENENFSGDKNKLNGAMVLPGSTYTMAALFGQTSGLPMKVEFGDEFSDTRGSFNNMNTQKSFFSGVTTLGDILKKEGYQQEFLLGSDATFGGRRLYFTQHGNYTINDYNEAMDSGRIPQGYYVFWGFEDQKLFQFAREDLQKLAADDKPFNLTILTVDTHFEDGYKCDLCPDTFGADQYANVMACSSRQTAEFIKWIQQQDFYKDTTIVINGDHLTMDSDFCDSVADDYNRRTYTAYINSAVQPQIKTERQYTTLDNFPTTLAALGAEIEGNRLGLGTNLFSSEQTLAEQLGFDKLSAEISRRSPFMEKLSDMDGYSDQMQEAVGMAPDAQVDVSLTDENTLHVQISDIENIYEKIKSADVKVKDMDSEEYAVSTSLEKGSESGTWEGDIDLSQTGYKNIELDASVTGKSGNSYDIGAVTGDMSLKVTDLNTYLSLLKNDPQYSVLVAVRDDASRKFTFENEQALKALGFEKSPRAHFRYSYYGVLRQPGDTDSEIGIEELTSSGTLPDGTEYAVMSQGGKSGAGGNSGGYLTCSVRIDGVEYAVKKIGMNFVIYDNEHHRVVDTVAFNTNDGIRVVRVDPSEKLETAAQNAAVYETESEEEGESEQQ